MAFEEAKAAYGIHQIKKSSAALKRLSRWNPQFRSGESILQEATSKTPFGYSAQERSAFNQALTRDNTQRFRMASQSNPNLSQNIQSGIDYGNTRALNEFAKNDAVLKRQNIQNLAGAITRQDNMNVQNQINQKSQMERAYGEAKRAGLANVFGAFDSKINDLKTVAAFLIPGAGMGAGGGGNAANPSGTTQMLGSLAGGKSLKSINPNASSSASAGAAGGNVVGDVPYNTDWKPYATPNNYTPFRPYSMTTNDWITNPNQFRP